MFKSSKKTGLAVVAAAALASAALATPSLAAPIDLLSPLNGLANEYQFGTGCAPGQAPAAGGTLDWHENASATKVTPEVEGSLCLQNTTDTYRIALVYYDNSHTKIGSYPAGKTIGNNSSLQTTLVARQGPRVLSSGMNHVHVVIQKEVGPDWVDQTSVTADYP